MTAPGYDGMSNPTKAPDVSMFGGAVTAELICVCTSAVIECYLQ